MLAHGAEQSEAGQWAAHYAKEAALDTVPRPAPPRPAPPRPAAADCRRATAASRAAGAGRRLAGGAAGAVRGAADAVPRVPCAAGAGAGCSGPPHGGGGRAPRRGLLLPLRPARATSARRALGAPAGRRVMRMRGAGASGGRGGGAGGAHARGGQGGGAWGRWCDVRATQERGVGAKNERRGCAVRATRGASGGEGQRGRCVLAGGGAPRRRGRREGGRRCGLGAIAARGVSAIPWSHGAPRRARIRAERGRGGSQARGGGGRQHGG